MLVITEVHHERLEDAAASDTAGKMTSETPPTPVVTDSFPSKPFLKIIQFIVLGFVLFF